MAETPIAPAPLRPEPFALANLFDLFVRPSQFFAGQIALGRKPALLFVAWIVGVGNALGFVDGRLVHDSVRQSPGRVFGTLAAGSLAEFWAVVAVAGMFSGMIVYQVGGWWYTQRLWYCGVRKADAKLPLHVYVYATFVADAPGVLASVVQSLRYGNYAAAYENTGFAESLWSWIPLFWSVIVSWKGVRAAFPSIRRGAAALWFLVLPCLFFMLLLALVAGEQE